jgi:alkanesulfonate monooxygenase SsuD/methylene tetrahydromethanopterin reductase-like flavin-dependent oxidoreductase (luciferase family)
MSAIALRYDLRRAPFAGPSWSELYRACIEQVAWCEQNNVADITVLSEHHGVEDGFSPSPFTLAAAIGARTTRMPITIAAALVPLHDPVRLVEQAITCDLITEGRVSFVAGIGYRADEFEMAGIDRSTRTQLLEEYVDVIRRAWTQDEFVWRGRTIRVTPRPFSPEPRIMIGGGVEASARRAARLRLPFLPSIADESLIEAYNDEAAKLGFTGGFAILPKAAGFVHVTEDPDKAWAELGSYAMYDAQTYASWQDKTRSQVFSSATDVEALRREGIYRIVTPDECLALSEELGPMGTITLHPLMCGMPIELGWSSLELFRDRVLPRLRPPPA